MEAFLTLSSSILYLNRFNDKMDTLIKKQENLYQEFIDSSQFSDHFKQEVEKISNQVNEDFESGDVDKYTIVIWLEGNDPECVDAIKGGHVRMVMNFNVIYE